MLFGYFDKMKFRSAFVILVGAVHGYLLWTQTGIAPFWLKRFPPATEFEIAIRWILLFVVAFPAIILNKALLPRNEKALLPRNEVGWPRTLFRTTYSFSVLYFPVVLLSQVLDIYFFPDIGISDAFGRYIDNWWLFPFEFTILNLTGIIIAFLISALLRFLAFVSAQFGGYP
jgi:hypothetical protein